MCVYSSLFSELQGYERNECREIYNDFVIELTKFVRYDRETLLTLMTDILHKIHNHHETRITDFEKEYDDIKAEEQSISFGFWRELDIVKDSSASIIQAPVNKLIDLLNAMTLPTSKVEREKGLHDFVGKCKAIKQEIANALVIRKEKLRDLFRQSLVYSPLVVIPERYFNPADGKKIYANYLHSANDQLYKVLKDPKAPYDKIYDISFLQTNTEAKLEAVQVAAFAIHYAEMSSYISALNSDAHKVFEAARAVCIDYSNLIVVYFLIHNLLYFIEYLY